MSLFVPLRSPVPFRSPKTDFAVAPVYLHDVGRISGLLAVYFFALVAQTLLERELR